MLGVARLGFGLVLRIVLEIFDMWDSHSCACTCRVMAICCAGLGSCLYVSVSGGSSSSDMSCAISNNNGCNFDICSECTVGLEGLF